MRASAAAFDAASRKALALDARLAKAAGLRAIAANAAGCDASACIAVGMAGDRVHHRRAGLARLRQQRRRILRRLGNAGEGVPVLGERGERLRVGHQRGHHLRLAGQGLEARAGRERAEVGVMNHELERVGLHQLGHRSVAERHVAFADLARHIALRRSDRALHSARAADRRARGHKLQRRTPGSPAPVRIILRLLDVDALSFLCPLD